MRNIFHIIFTALLLCCLYVRPQQLLFNNISRQLGIPAQESYNVMQDRKGYIWISTEAGLCKYNGTQSTIFNKRNGLPEHACYAVKEDEHGDLWVLTSANRILRCLNDSLIETTLSKPFVSLLKGSLKQAHSLSFINDSVFINTQQDSYTAGINSKKVTVLDPDSSYGYYFHLKKNEILNFKSIKTMHQLIDDAKKGFISLGINAGAETKKININFKSKDQPGWRVITAKNNKDENFIAFAHTLIRINKDLSYTITELPCQVISLYCDDEAGLWVGTIKGGVFYYPNSQNLQNKTISLDGFSVSGICVDNENGVWCTTLEKGVFYSRNKNIITYNNIKGLDKAADLLSYAGGKLFASSGGNELLEIKKDTVLRYPLELMGTKSISGILKDNNKWLINGASIVLRVNELFKDPVYLKNTTNIFNTGANQVVLTDNNKLFGISYGHICEINGNISKTILSPLESGGKCINFIDAKDLLYGCKNGLYKLTIKDDRFLSKKIGGVTCAVTKIFKSKGKTIWVTTKENGLFIYKNDSLINVTDKLHLPSELLYDINEDIFGTIWLGSNIGIIALNPKNEQPDEMAEYSLRIYDILNGLPSNQVYRVTSDSNFIYLSTTDGIIKFNLRTNLTNNIPPRFYLNSVEVNGKKYPQNKLIQLDHRSNSLRFKFDILTFKTESAPTLIYTLKAGNKKSFKEEKITRGIISLDNLTPDIYELRISAINNNGILSISPIVLNFEIFKPFWQKAWFIIGCIICLALILFIIVKQIIQNIRNKAEEKTRINKQLAEFQLTALRAQMNPHFIFNAINSIQNYILKKKEQEAYNYLAKFSKLIRMVLNNSEQQTLSLHEELETVKLYVELEQIRFKDSFGFEIKMSETINPYDIQIPSMLIQPFVENSIWHGLMNLDSRTGKLTITLTIQSKFLTIVIEDNGIGREQAALYRSESVHKPVAMKLTEKRLFTINSMQDYIGAKVIVTDLYNERKDPCGTRVEVFIPIEQN